MSFPVSARWYPALQNSHQIAVQFAVFAPGTNTALYVSPVFTNVNSPPTPIVSGPGIGLYPNPVIADGSVTYEKKSAQRSRFSMTISDPTGLLVSQNILTPWGNQIKIYAGIKYADGTVEMPIMGTFRITDVDSTDEGGNLKISVKGQDLSRIVSRNKVVQFYQTASNQAYTDAIRSMVSFAYPAVRFNATADQWRTTPPAGINVGGISPNMIYTPIIYGITYQEGSDLWNEARNLAAAVACDLFFDRHGVCELREDPNLNYMDGSLPSITKPVYDFIEGETATFTGVAQNYSDANAFNQWRITGEGQVIGYTQSPLRSDLMSDNDPNSKTYVLGPYGPVTGFETNSLMVSVAQINTYARFKLATTIGEQQTIVLTAFTDTSLNIDDPIACTRARVGVSKQLFIIDSLQVPLAAKSKMSVKTRERRALTYT